MVSRGISVIPKSTNPTRLIQNITYPELTESQIKQVSDFHKLPGMHKRLTIDDALAKEGGTVVGWTLEELGWNP